MLFINNNNGSTHLGNCIQKTFGFFPSKTWIGNRFSVNMITSDLLISRFNITLDHKPFYQSMKFRVYLAAVENLFCNTNLLVILFIRIRVVGINDNSRIFKVFLLIFLPEKTKILVMVVRDRFPMLVYRTAIQSVGNTWAPFAACVIELAARILCASVLSVPFGYRAVCFATPFAWLTALSLLIPVYIVLIRKLVGGQSTQTKA